MLKRNPNFSLLSSHYLFAEIAKRKSDYLARNPTAKLCNLGIGDTTRPLTPLIGEAMAKYAKALTTKAGYHGYGDGAGEPELRKAIADRFYKGIFTPDEIFVSDGAKSDIARLQVLFGKVRSIAVQDPSYPPYVDGSLLMGIEDIRKLPSTFENNFFPDLAPARGGDLIYFCSPNNPTGAVATKKQLQELVAFAKKEKALILFDNAYSAYIRSSELPKSIFEIEGAKEVAIEINSFSKMAGFTGVRVGWSALSKDLSYPDGGSIFADWKRVISTTFNGASNVAQAGAVAALSPEGWSEVQDQIDAYMKGAAKMADFLRKMGFQVVGGDNAPYCWVKIPGRSSWETFQFLLEEASIVSVPGSGFGPSGEGYIRLSAFSPFEEISEALDRLHAIQSL